MIHVDDVVAKLERRFPNLERVGDTTFRGMDLYDERPFAIRYFELNDDLEASAGQLHEYQDGLLGTSYFNPESKADLRWNHYLYFITSPVRNEAFFKAKAAVESDREYARKFVVTEDELDQVLNHRVFGAEGVTGLPPDALSIWTAILEEHALGYIVDQSLQVPAVTRHIAEGERKPVLRPPAPPQLDSAEIAATTQFLSSIAIRGFRKYPNRKEFAFGAVNLIVGVNGVGKTSLLEAIEYLFCGKTRRAGSLLPATSLSGVLSGSQRKLLTTPRTSQSALRARHLAWYGKSELRTLTLDDSFSKFNFLDTDAAARLSVETSQEQIIDDLSQLLLGAEASKAIDRFERVLRQLGNDKKDVERDIAIRDQRVSEAVERIQLLRNAPRASESLFSDLLSTLRSVGWMELPADKSRAGHVSEQIQMALASVTLLKSSSPLVLDNPAELDVTINLLTEAENAIAGLLEGAALRARAQSGAKLRLQQTAKRLEALDALVPLVASGIGELHRRRAELMQALTQRASNLVEVESAVANVPADPAYATEPLSAVVVKWTETVRAAAALVETSKAALSGFERTQNLLASLQQRLRSSAQEIIQHTGDASHCPLCRAEYPQAELLGRIEQLTRGAMTDESDRLRANVHTALTAHEQHSLELTALRTLQGYLKAEASEIQLDAALARVTDDHARIATWTSELDAVNAALQAQTKKGFTMEQLEQLERAAGVSRAELASEAIDALRANLLDEQKELTAGIEGLETAARDASLQLSAIAATNGFRDIHPDELGQHVSGRKSVLESQRRAISSLRARLDLSRISSPLELESHLRAAQDITVQLRTSLAKESQESDAMKQEVKRQNDAQAELDGLRVRLRRLDGAVSVLEELLAQQSERALAERVQQENATRIASTFAKIHAPNEFDLMLNGGLSIVRRGVGKVELNEMSSGQRAAYALSLFLAMNERLTTGPKVLLFDDPVAHVDDINTLSLLDHLREIALTNQRQIFFATADSKIAALFARKFRFLGEHFKQIDLSRD